MLEVSTCRCSWCGRTVPRAPGLNGKPCAHTREIRQAGDVFSEFRPCSNLTLHTSGRNQHGYFVDPANGIDAVEWELP